MPAFRRVPTDIWVVPRSGGPIVIATIGAGLPWARRVTGILEQDGLDAVVRRVTSPEAAAGALERPPDVVLLPHRPGAAEAGRTLHGIRQHLPGAGGVVVVVPEPEESAVRGLVAAGVDGLVVEGELEATLAPVVRAVCAGQISVPQGMRYLIEPAALSHREKQVLALVISGCGNAEIARRLCLAESTVKAHLSSAFRRLGVRSRREAAAAVLKYDASLRRGVLMTLRAERTR